jgi:hypothetical protein
MKSETQATSGLQAGDVRRIVESAHSFSAAERRFRTDTAAAESIRENFLPLCVVKRSFNELLCLNAGLARYSAFTTE